MEHAKSVTFLWSDSWILQAIVLASRDRAASLAAVIAAADDVNHALPTADELHGALLRLTEGGYIEDRDGTFASGARLSGDVRLALLTTTGSARARLASSILGAEPWSAANNVDDPRNNVRYPGLSDEKLHAAEQEYRRKGRR